MRALVAALLSLVSLFGGHCLNRRWDRIVVFGVIALLVTTACWVGFSRELTVAADGGSIADTFTAFARAQLLAMAALLIASATVSFSDARRPLAQSGHVLAMTAGVIASVAVGLLTLTSAAGLVYTALSDAKLTVTSNPASSSELERRYNFTNHIRLGSEVEAEGDPEPLPEGSATLRGRVLFRGQEQEGVTLRLTLNGQYETGQLRTDDNGEFAVAVPPGEWRINQVRTQGWTGKPDEARYTLLTGHEPDYHLPYKRWRVHGQEPPAIELPNDKAAPHLTLTIRRAIDFDWPPHSDNPARARIDEDTIAWTDASDAERYVVTVRRIEKEGNTTHYRTRTYAPTDGKQRLPLSKLPTADAKGRTNMYQVDVHGFDDAGRLVNYNTGTHPQAQFRLQGKKIVANDGWIGTQEEAESKEQPIEPVDWQARSRADDRLEAVHTLIDADMPAAAGQLLDKVDPEHAPPGELPVARGYLAASQGRCREARKHFDVADDAEEDVCISSCYYADCPKPER